MDEPTISLVVQVVITGVVIPYLIGAYGLWQGSRMLRDRRVLSLPAKSLVWLISRMIGEADALLWMRRWTEPTHVRAEAFGWLLGGLAGCYAGTKALIRVIALASRTLGMG